MDRSFLNRELLDGWKARLKIAALIAVVASPLWGTVELWLFGSAGRTMMIYRIVMALFMGLIYFISGRARSYKDLLALTYSSYVVVAILFTLIQFSNPDYTVFFVESHYLLAFSLLLFPLRFLEVFGITLIHGTFYILMNLTMIQSPGPVTAHHIFSMVILLLFINIVVPANRALRLENIHATRTLRLRNKELYDMANLDALTGIANRRYFMDRLEKTFNQADPTFMPLLVLLDLDNFKEINDSKGHLEGDRVLTRVAEILSRNIREGDLCGRLGGDEFAILIHRGGGTADVMPLLKRIHASCQEEGIRLSCGYARMHRGESLLKFLTRADRALYKAKHDGKNRISGMFESIDEAS
ncbi:MAG TPA: GGDEF domain-containing protein [Thermoanaerobaculia bacterium]|nr:GGDEF domain-containing protein [Thermoanaerobaculia bacterium]HUM29935.1 GGDEF domain-containing protein [Thermoanaerobaculia bacterium]HXK68198.1 GGDEF domain-containing protein [Thermoanaerobaculia bacterium]